MSRRFFKKDFRMSAEEYERFDRVRRAQGCGFRPWSDFIRDALTDYVEAIEAKSPGRFPPAVTPPALMNPFREVIREKPTPLPPVEPQAEESPASDKRPSEKKKPAAAKTKVSKRSA